MPKKLIYEEDAIAKFEPWLKVEGYSEGELNMLKAVLYELRFLPTAQPPIKPVDYQDCAMAMLRMWMDNVVTDGEYYRIMDKLNEFWGKTNNE